MSLNISCRVAGGWCAAALLAVLVGASGVARADAVSSPPSCPEGASPDGCHSGPFCRPLDCSSEPACPEGKVCQMVEKCAQSFECGGGFTTGAAGTRIDDILGECGEGGTCAKGTCQMFKLCVAETATTSGTGGSGASEASGADSGDVSASGGDSPKKPLGCAGCRAGEDGSPALLLLALLGLSIRRRRAARA